MQIIFHLSIVRDESEHRLFFLCVKWYNNKQKNMRERHEAHNIEYAVTIVFEVFKG